MGCKLGRHDYVDGKGRVKEDVCELESGEDLPQMEMDSIVLRAIVASCLFKCPKSAAIRNKDGKD
jgi:hypothetical protein